MIDHTVLWRWLFWTFVIAALVWPLIMEWLRHRPYNLKRQTQHLVLYGIIGMTLFGACAIIMITEWRIAAKADRAAAHQGVH